MSKALTFIAISIGYITSLLVASFASGFFKGLAVFLDQNTFWIPLVVFVVYFGFLYVSNLRYIILNKDKRFIKIPYVSKHETEGWMYIGLYILFVLSGALFGYTVLQPPGAQDFGKYLLEILAIPYALLLYLGGAVLIGETLIRLFPFGVGLVALFTNHPAAKLVDEAKAPRPSAEVEQELAALMKRQDATDDQMLAVFNELSSFKKLMWSTKLRLRLHKLRELREAADLQATVSIEETELAVDVHQRERHKRRRP